MGIDLNRSQQHQKKIKEKRKVTFFDVYLMFQALRSEQDVMVRLELIRGIGSLGVPDTRKSSQVGQRMNRRGKKRKRANWIVFYSDALFL